MPNGTSSDQETIEATIAPFYHAIGRATARWQHVEAGLFVLAHAIMQTDYKYSSVVFLHIQSAASKVKLVDRLCPRSLVPSRMWLEFEGGVISSL